MKNKVLFIIIISLSCIFMLTGCDNNLTDSEKFKKEYESLNNIEKNGKVIRNIKIKKDNPFVYASEKDIINLMDRGETFVVYFGFAECPWCRSILETLINVVDDLDIDKVYYVDVQDIRDTLKLDEDGNIITSKKGTDDYYILLEKLDNVLENYELVDSKGNNVNTKEKRIYAPSIVSIVNGKAESLESGISKNQTDAYMKLTDDMIKETYDLFECSLKCIVENKGTCSKGC